MDACRDPVELRRLDGRPRVHRPVRRRRRISDHKRPTLAPPPVNPPSHTFEAYAFRYFVDNLTIWPNNVADIENDQYTHVICSWESAGPGSSLRLAVSAVSLIVLWQEHRQTRMLNQAQTIYALCISKVHKEMEHLSSERIDHLVVTTTLMATYEVVARFYW